MCAKSAKLCDALRTPDSGQAFDAGHGETYLHGLTVKTLDVIFVGFYCEGSDGGRRHRPARTRGNSEARGLKQDHYTMSDDLKFQLRLTLSDEFAQVARNDPGDPSISTLTDILNRHDAVMKCQFDAFADYVSEAEANGIENFHLYEWTKKTIDDPAKKAKYTKSFALYVGGDEVYEKDKADDARGRAEASSRRSHRREDVQIRY